jgi:ribonucleotide reductase beta subunit family protein with ferritin-like domain
VYTPYSYSYLLNNVYPDPTKFFDSIMEDKEITSRAELIRNNFDKILGDDEKKDPKQKIFDAILSINVMEGLVFYGTRYNRV